MIVRGRRNESLPSQTGEIIRAAFLKLLGIVLEEDQTRSTWDLQFQALLSKANNRLYIIRICKHWLPLDQLDFLLRSHMLSLVQYGIEIWASSFYSKYPR